MKIFIAGATGRVATKLIDDLLADGHQIVAGSRHPEQQAKKDGVTPVKLDLHASVVALAKLVEGSQAIYFTAGSRGKDLLQTDAFGAVKLAKAAEQDGIKRFIMLSSLFALEPEKWEATASLRGIMDYNIAKFFADNYLVAQSQLNYTILQPSVLKETAGQGTITIDDGQDGENSIEDVAETLAEILEHDNTVGKVIKMRAGTTPIATALSRV